MGTQNRGENLRQRHLKRGLGTKTQMVSQTWGKERTGVGVGAGA